MIRLYSTKIVGRILQNSRQYSCFRNRNGTILNRERLLILRPYENNVMQRRKLFFDPTSRSIIVDPFYVTLLLVGSAYFGLKCIFIREYIDRVNVLRDSNYKPAMMKRKLMEELDEVLEQSNIDSASKKMDSVQFHFGTSLRPSVESSFYSRFAICVMLPFTMNCMLEGQTEEEKRADLEKFCELKNISLSSLESTMDEDGDSMRAQLEENLFLSSKARKFVELWMVHSATMPFEPAPGSFILTFVPLGLLSLVNMLHSRENMAKFPNIIRSTTRAPLSVLAIALGYVISAQIIPMLVEYKYRYGSNELIQKECQTDQQKANEMIEGAREFFAKTEKLEQIVARFSADTNRLKLSNFWQIFVSGYDSSKVQLSAIESKLSGLTSIDRELNSFSSNTL